MTHKRWTYYLDIIYGVPYVHFLYQGREIFKYQSDPSVPIVCTVYVIV